jgi:hypothetical protein|tara:strand:- start:1088 stop:1648 length:561 start_codon:yes stop_codon:yes gene_type:complete
MITQEQWELIDDKYGKLLSKICTKISGDAATASFEDNLQDLRIATLEAVAGFAKKEGQPFDSFWGTMGFNKYMKTCLWNLKNKKGARISKRYAIHKNTVDVTEYSDILVSQDTDSSSISVDSFFEDSKHTYNEDQETAIRTVVKNPYLVKPNGRINIRKLSTEIGFCVAKTRKILDSIKKKTNINL